jgi:glutamate N-acetyltransferase/amino-acid N-acetyltransferase
LKSDTVVIYVDLKSGAYKATSWGCDLSKKYVEINAEYLT